MASDNIRDAHRDQFNQLYVEVMEHLLRRAVELDLPNAYMETVIARMLAMRSAACDDDIDIVSERVLAMSKSYSEEHASLYEQARELGRYMRAWQKVKH